MITVANSAPGPLPESLIPLPTAAATTRRQSGDELAGAAQVLLQKELTGRRLAEEVGRLFEFQDARREMAEHAKSRGRPQAARDIANLLAALAR
jgi:UDP-N-acetylglucosamine--N-acetylmuramyl-(pentapeptide) pyrophosphoryl-undecaprenol N-acetylglucosamine transferase